MNHPRSRSERRFNAEVWRNRQRRKMLDTWSKHNSSWFTDNNMWWARKQSSGHGNRCMCHCEKTSRKEIRKRREGLDARGQKKTVRLCSLQEGSQTREYESLGQIILLKHWQKREIKIG